MHKVVMVHVWSKKGKYILCQAINVYFCSKVSFFKMQGRGILPNKEMPILDFQFKPGVSTALRF